MKWKCCLYIELEYIIKIKAQTTYGHWQFCVEKWFKRVEKKCQEALRIQTNYFYFTFEIYILVKKLKSTYKSEKW